MKDFPEFRSADGLGYLQNTASIVKTLRLSLPEDQNENPMSWLLSEVQNTLETDDADINTLLYDK
jgi:hypothetical protein